MDTYEEWWSCPRGTLLHDRWGCLVSGVQKCFYRRDKAVTAIRLEWWFHRLMPVSEQKWLPVLSCFLATGDYDRDLSYVANRENIRSPHSVSLRNNAPQYRPIQLQHRMFQDIRASTRSRFWPALSHLAESFLMFKISSWIIQPAFSRRHRQGLCCLFG
jgi:hypothetical protein